MEVLIIGDGPQRPELEALVKHYNLDDTVRFVGWIDHDKIAQTLRNYDVLALPSVREFGGGVVLEAMALGLVPVVADYGGPAELIDRESGVAVPFTDRASLVAGFSQAFQSLMAADTPLRRLRNGAASKVSAHFTWSAKARQMLSIYHWVLKSGPKPDFSFSTEPADISTQDA
jgi:glycosyltransferase involved in cell wall biosynthesis